MSRELVKFTGEEGSFPRPRGDEPVGGSFDNEAQQFSPPARG